MSALTYRPKHTMIQDTETGMQTGSHWYTGSDRLAKPCMICTQRVATRLVRYFCSNVCIADTAALTLSISHINHNKQAWIYA